MHSFIWLRQDLALDALQYSICVDIHLVTTVKDDVRKVHGPKLPFRVFLVCILVLCFFRLVAIRRRRGGGIFVKVTLPGRYSLLRQMLVRVHEDPLGVRKCRPEGGTQIGVDEAK